jgi:predicted adenylyl cyclase CyaB
MPANVEIKARISSVDALLETARALSDDAHLQLIHQDDTFFSVPHGRLKLRVFGDGSGELIHYHRLDSDGPKRSDYRIAPVSEPESLREVLALGCGLLGRVRKSRILALVGLTRIHLDQVEGLGDFLEIEVVLREGQTEAEGQGEAQALMARLGVTTQDLVPGAYLDLLRVQQAAAEATPPAAPLTHPGLPCQPAGPAA